MRVRPCVSPSLLSLSLSRAAPSSQNPEEPSNDAAPGDGGVAGGWRLVRSGPDLHRDHGVSKGTGGAVSLRGDFAADGWTTGIDMSKNANGDFEVTLPVKDRQVVVYKLVVDGNSIADPDNPRKSPDGFGMFNWVNASTAINVQRERRSIGATRSCTS